MLIGHWSNIQEAEKLTDTVLIGGIITEYIKQGGLLTLTSPGLPVGQFNGLSVSWNREKDAPTAAFMENVGALLQWQSGQNFDKLTRALKSIYVQTYLDDFLPDVYQTVNNYRAIQLMANKRAMIERIETSMIYGHEASAVNALEFDGLHTLASRFRANYHDESLDIDGADDQLSLMDLRELSDAMKHGVDYWIMPKALARNLDAYAQEGGLESASNVIGRMSYGQDSLGTKTSFWDDVPIIRSDWMVPENTGTGLTDASRRQVSTSGASVYSVFAIKMGQVYEAMPGLTLAWGNNGGGMGELWKTVVFDKLEDRDAEGLRLISHMSLLDGSTMSVGRIHDVAAGRVRA